MRFAVCFTDDSKYGASGPFLPVGEWHHCIGTWDGSNVKLYLDGELVSTSSDYSGLIMNDITHSLTIGKRNSPSPPYYEHFWGKVDQVRIYNRALKEEEVRERFNGS